MQKQNLQRFDQLFNQYYTNLCRFCFTYVKDNYLAEEIVQEVFITFWEKMGALEITISERSFLYTSVRNRALNYLRDSTTRMKHESTFAEEQSQKVEYPSYEWDKNHMETSIQQAIAELPEKCRQIFELSRNNNLTYRQIADQLDISPKTVENQVSIAIKKLKERLAEYLNVFL